MTEREKRVRWFQEARFGMFLHWGLYAIPGRGEWYMSGARMPAEEYERYMREFTAKAYDPRDWARRAKQAGMRYVVLTAKHHDGFCMWDTDTTDYCINHSPNTTDVVKAVADACEKYGIKLGLYYSEELDWHEPDGGGYTFGHTNCGVMSWTNDWDFPENGKKDYARCFEGKIKTQMKEILTQYGDLCLIWCDTPMDIKPAQSRELYDMIKHYQPDCLVNSRIGNGLGDYRSTGDNEEAFDTAEGAGNAPDSRPGEALVRTGLYECPATLNDTWGYKPFDQNWKSPDRVRELRRSLNARGINYLLNIGPDPLGRLPAPAVDILRRAAE